jgi:hypothetical protein
MWLLHCLGQRSCWGCLQGVQGMCCLQLLPQLLHFSPNFIQSFCILLIALFKIFILLCQPLQTALQLVNFLQKHQDRDCGYGCSLLLQQQSLSQQSHPCLI